LTEFKVWRDVKLPAGKILIPGVVSYSTDLVEHPELGAVAVMLLGELVGRENVIAGTDCGLGGRVHPQITWAKLRALRDRNFKWLLDRQARRPVVQN
jgi:5-methyltetrahydropteroyltriglutamate--homocysteine methyltransferase